MNIKKLTINALLLAVGALLHQITPALGLPMQPDFALAMLFIIVMLNKGDYKTSLVTGIITGVFTAMTTKFPGGQIPNMLDKLITVNFVYILIFIISKIKILKNLSKEKENYIIALIIFPLGTLMSGIVFLLSAQAIVGLPAEFMTLILTIVLPATIINLIAGVFLYKVVNLSLLRASCSLKR
ncbi:MAG: tryptophan transporter [Clostridium argentinense]|uniref:Tryptophan transporter n=1 Tax=Clostridium faecium TaxID=2762223 RepID=A0ABR8YQJ1_9CLOT|nr:tryptophan transporter [Clostridium faecium]MBD8046507.1 tryptophan transporter [Clostridium faecium]MBS5823020.1 tryptophan transporter [Clostridium argentinense]MDU1349178.1 tryptophan transporter [Clostridium argentinense]